MVFMKISMWGLLLIIHSSRRSQNMWISEKTKAQNLYLAGISSNRFQATFLNLQYSLMSSPDMRIAQEEIFGPVVSLIKCAGY